MKKKKEKSSNPLPPSDDLDLKSLIHQNSLFFDKLVELIPARFYLPVGDNEKPWFQGLSKVAKASAKKKSRENIKKSRRDRLDPEKSTSTLDLLKQSLEETAVAGAGDKSSDKEKEDEDNSSSENEAEIVQISPTRDDVTYEELRQRLHRKIEELRSNRHAPGSDDISNRAKKREIQQGKRKRYEESKPHSPKPNHPKLENAPLPRANKTEEDVEKASEGLAFTHVKIGSDDGGARKKKKLSKLQLLEQAKKLDDAKKEDPEVAKKHALKAATSRAAGIKVHDDPKLVSKSIKKEKKKHQKNVDKWKERIESKEKLRTEKQQARSKNITDRIKQKKMRRIAKREKKLMQPGSRPGFEGRTDKYLNASTES